MAQKIWILIITFPVVLESAVLDPSFTNSKVLSYEDGSHITSFWDNFDSQKRIISQPAYSGDSWHPFRRQDETSEKEYVLLKPKNGNSGGHEALVNNDGTNDVISSSTSAEGLFSDDEDVEIPKKYLRIPHSQSHLKRLVRAMVTRNICSRQDKDNVIRVLSEGRKERPTLADLGLVKSGTKKSFILCRVRWGGLDVNVKRGKRGHKRDRGNKSGTSQNKKSRTRRLKLHKNTHGGDTYLKWPPCDSESIRWNFTHLQFMESKLHELDCWDEETADLHGKVAKLMLRVSRGKRRYHKLQHLKCDLVDTLEQCRDKHLRTGKTTSPAPTTTTTTTETPTTTTSKPKPEEHTVSIEVLHELQRDIGFDYNSGVFDEPFLFY